MTIGDANPSLQLAIGLADCCELMSRAFRFPETDELARAIECGAFRDDLINCLTDAQADEEKIRAAEAEISKLEHEPFQALHEKLKKGHSILFLTPGGFPPVWPYEGPFEYVRRGNDRRPSLFRSKITLDVEQKMKDAGIRFKDARREPCDSIWNEFSYLAYLYGLKAQAQFESKPSNEIEEHIEIFYSSHFKLWARAFMQKTAEEASNGQHSFGKEFAVLARVANLVIDVIDNERAGNTQCSESLR